MLTLSWEDLGDPGLVYNLYSGTLDTFYSHAPIGCHLSPAPGPSGSLSFDVPVPAGDVYYLVTASSSAAEGSAGPRPISPTSAACGPAP